MTKAKPNPLRYVTGALFVVLSIYTFATSRTSWVSLTTILCYLLITAGLFTGKYMLLTLGAGIKLICCALNLFSALSQYGPIITLSYCLSIATEIICWFLFLLASTKKDSATVFSVVAAIAMIFYCLLYCKWCKSVATSYQLYKSQVITTLLRIVPLCISIVLTGIAIAPTKATANVNNASNNSFVQSTAMLSTIEQLSRLKQLLDAGAITQEEFDSKKAELIGH